MKKSIYVLSTWVFLLALGALAGSALAQETDASMFWKKSNKYITEVESKTGDLYKKLGHHGPAVENLWVGYRIYFNKSMSIDLLSKFQPRLELKTGQWYGSDSLFSENYGKDNFKVGQTVGLGGLRLWENDSAKFFDTQIKRTGRVLQTKNTASIIVTSYGVPYQNQLIDIEVKLSVFENKRHALIETTVLSGQKVRFATGMVKHSELQVAKSKNCILTWGDYDSPVAAEKFDVGAALIFNEKHFSKQVEEEKQLLLISKPTKYLKYYVTSANQKESKGVNTLDAFKMHVNKLAGIFQAKQARMNNIGSPVIRRWENVSMPGVNDGS